MRLKLIRRAGFIAVSTLLFIQTACIGTDQTDSMLDSSGKSFLLAGVSGLKQVSQLTGAESPNKTERYAVYGTDLGSMINDGDRTYFVFGDTFGERSPNQIGGGGSLWRSNVIAYTTDNDPSDGISLDGMIEDDLGFAKELIPSAKRDHEEMTTIPTHGLAANGALYLFYMSVNHWGEPGSWDANYASVAKSTDKGQSWVTLDNVKWPGDSNFVQVSPYAIRKKNGKSELYFWCIPSGRFGGVKLMKVSEENVEDPLAYRYFTGIDDRANPIWDADSSKAKLVVEDTAGELSVVWNPYLERWLMTYLKEGRGVVIREGFTPWGPWGEAIDLVKAADHPGLYAPFMNDRYTEEGGKTFYFTLSLWEPYNVFWYKATLQK